jgi:hypothetical protein
MTGAGPEDWLRPAFLVGLYGIVIFASLLYASNFSLQVAFVAYLKDVVIAILNITLLHRKRLCEGRSGMLIAGISWEH